MLPPRFEEDFALFERTGALLGDDGPGDRDGHASVGRARRKKVDVGAVGTLPRGLNDDEVGGCEPEELGARGHDRGPQVGVGVVVKGADESLIVDGGTSVAVAGDGPDVCLVLVEAHRARQGDC